MKTLKIKSNLLYTMLVAIMFVGCKKEQLYTSEECAKLKKGDTIYTHEFYSYDKCVVLNNIPEKELIEVASLKYYLDTNVLSYDDFRFK